MYNGLSEEGKGGYGQEVIIYKANLVGFVWFLNQKSRYTGVHWMS